MADRPFATTILDYSVEILVPGFPGKSTQNGGLGWSTVVLLRGHGRTILLDTGTFGLRKVLRERLADRGIAPDDVTDVILSHAHYDHIVNFPMFGSARLIIGAEEMEWAAEVPPGVGPVPELYVEALRRSRNLRLIAEGEEILPHVIAHPTPGHTPGHMSFIVSGDDRDVICVQDAAKTLAELVSGETDMTYDDDVSRATIESIWSLWKHRAGSIVVPGHDMPLALAENTVVRIGRSQAGISAVFGKNLADITRFELPWPDC